MSLAANGITADVIREMMPPYHLSTDLLEATLAALPAPPPDATAAWRQVRVARLMQEFATLMPANAAQARTVSQVLIMRELADAIAARAHAPELTEVQMARVGRASAELSRTATGLVRALERTQQKPAPFFGNVLADEVDVVALAAGWGERGTGAGPVQQAGGLGQEEPAPGRKEDPASNPRVERPGACPVQLSGAPERAIGRHPAGTGGEAAPEPAPALPCGIASFARDPGTCEAGDRREAGGRGDCDH